MTLDAFLALVVLAVFVGRLVVLLQDDKITERIRKPLEAKLAPDSYPAFLLLICAWCPSVWFAILAYVSWRLWPVATLHVAGVGAIAFVGAIVVERARLMEAETAFMRAEKRRVDELLTPPPPPIPSSDPFAPHV